MFGADDDPFRRFVGMMAENVSFEGEQLGREEFEAKTKFLGALRATLPTVVRNDRAIYLHTGREVVCDDPFGQGLGLGAGGDRGPSDEHEAGFAGASEAASREISP